MSVGNLGIVFGPTLLRPLVSGDMSMSALLETSYQALLVEFLITHNSAIFGPPPRPCTPPPPAPTAPLPATPPRPAGASLPGTPDTLSRDRPRSLEVSGPLPTAMTSPASTHCFDCALFIRQNAPVSL